jgi:hypothetical protein
MTTIDDATWKLSGDELNAYCQNQHRTGRQSDANVLTAIRRMSQRGDFPPEYPSLTAWISELLVLTKKEAADYLHLALADVPIAKESAAEGLISIPQLGVIVRLMDDIIDDATQEQREHAEQTLTDAAVEVDTRGLKGLGAKIKGYLGIDGPAPKNDPDGRDPRNQEERDGDALAEIIGLAAKCNEHTQGGDDTAVNVTIPLTDLRRVEQGTTLLPGLGNLSPEALRRLVCDARVIPIVLGSKGEVLDVGRSSRLATTAQRRALEARDKGCVFIGCTRTAKWCTPHHIRHWAHGGPTDLGNMALLCAHHHRKIHHSQWEMEIIDGLPWLIPPAFLDPERKPLRNTWELPIT